MRNDHLVLIGGKSGTGKSAALMGLTNPTGVMYLNCEAGKKLPFKSQFREYTIMDPLQIYEAFDKAETDSTIHTIVVDTITYMMDMYESLHVLTSSNTMKAWGDYAQFFKTLMSQYVARSTKNVVFLAHTSDLLNEADMAMETMVKVKGSLMNQGIESYFSTVVGTKKVALSKLSPNQLLNITPQETALGFKHVFQTQITKESIGERIRSPLQMFAPDETYIDNDCQKLIDRLHQYYA